jgi:branched-subunit amino acid transport protein
MTAELGTAAKMLDAARRMPFWLLAAAVIVSVSVWSQPALQASLPPAVIRWLPFVVVAIAVLAACQATSIVWSRVASDRQVAAERDHKRLTKLYRPFVSLFLTRHVTTSSSTGAPYLRHRIGNAWHELSSYRRMRVGVVRAFHALFDKRISSSSEVEFGGDFPLKEILKLTREHSEHADDDLLDLVRRADRSRYEDGDSARLTEEEVALFGHIWEQHKRLTKKVA